VDIPRTVSAAPTIQAPPDLTNMRRFLTSPIPRQCGIIQCYIRRNKNGTNKLFPVYSLYLKEGDVFLMASKKRPKNKTSNYLISMDQNDLNRSGSNYLGKLRSNFVGTEFQVFDDGINPKDGADNDDNQNTNVRCEMGGVMYAANVLGSRGPRKMQVAIPGVNENLEIIKWRDSMGPSGTGTNDDMLTRIKDRNFRDMVYLINKPPRWNEQVGAYVLNFNGRVTMASVKNFQLVDPEEQNSVVLQFGRVGKDEFTMDMQWPISPFQAFAVTLSSFDSKIACD
jgi:tubby-related protein 1